MTYTKDNGKYLRPLDFSGTFGLPLNDTCLALINSCKYSYKDKGGEYVYDATSFDEKGSVYFTKIYIKK